MGTVVIMDIDLKPKKETIYTTTYPSGVTVFPTGYERDYDLVYRLEAVDEYAGFPTLENE